jgi:hypothetical protein
MENRSRFVIWVNGSKEGDRDRAREQKLRDCSFVFPRFFYITAACLLDSSYQKELER